MTLPAGFTTGLAKRGAVADLWLEIEGLPYAYGLNAQVAGFFAGRATAYKRDGVRPMLTALPAMSEQEVRPLDGESTIGQLTAKIMDESEATGIADQTALQLITGVGRTDKLLPADVGARWAATTAYSSVNKDLVRPTIASVAAGRLHWFKCTTGGNSGGAEPNWPTAGTVADGTCVWTHMDALDLDDTASSGFVPYAGTADAAALPLGGGRFYIGRETFTYTGRSTSGTGGGHFTGVVRWQYQLDGFQNKLAHTAGDLISPYPRFLFSRRVSLYLSMDGTETNKVAVWAGNIRDYHMADDLGALELVMETIESEFKITAFTGQRKAILQDGIPGPGGKDDFNPNSDESAPLDGIARCLNFQDYTWSGDEYLFVRIDDEFMLCRATVALNADGSYGSLFLYFPTKTDPTIAFADSKRGLFGSAVAQHHAGASVTEVMVIAKTAASGPLKYSKFSAGDHPLDVVRQLLCSRLGTAVNGAYDTLPTGYGAGVDNARVDNTEIDKLKNDWIPDARHVEIVEAPFNIKDKIAEILRPFGCYPVNKLGNLLTIRRISPPAAGAWVLDDSRVVAKPTWDAGLADPVEIYGRVLMRSNWDPAAGEFLHVQRAEIQGPGIEAQEFYANLYATLEIDARGQYSSTPFNESDLFGSAANTRDDELFAALRDLVQDRYSKPAPTYVLECDYMALQIEVGDLVTVTNSALPNVASGGRGVADTCEVTRKRISHVDGKVILTVKQTYYGRQYRNIAPSMTVVSWNAGALQLTVAAHDYTDPAGTVNDSNGLDEFMPLRCINRDMTTPSTTVIFDSYVSPTVLQLRSAPVPAPTAGQIFLLADYDDQVAAGGTFEAAATSAFLCNAAQPQTLGPSTKSPPHQYAS